MRRLVLLIACWLLLGAVGYGAERIIRLAPLPENPPQADEAGHRTWSRMHQLGGIDEQQARAFIFLPVSVEYVRILADEEDTSQEQLAALGPWIDGFWIHSNVYDYTTETPVDVSAQYANTTLELRWGAPTAGDTSIIPEPGRSLVLRAPVSLASGLWFRAEFVDTATAQDFQAAPLRQVRLKDGETTLVFDMEEWLDLDLFAPAAGATATPGVIAPLATP